MNKEHRELLRRNRSYIRDNIANIPPVLDLLFEKNVLSSDMIEQINNETKSKQAYLMLDFIPKRGPNAFGFFIESLNDSGNEELAEHLRKGNIPVNTNFTVKDISQPIKKTEPSTCKTKDAPKNSDPESNAVNEQPADDKLGSGEKQKRWIKSSTDSSSQKSTDEFYEEMSMLYNNDFYHMVSKNKGRCFFLFTHKYTCDHCRDGDKTRLQMAIKSIGYEFKDVMLRVRKDFNKEDIESELQRKLGEIKGTEASFVLIAVTTGKDCDRIYGTGGESDFLLVSEMNEMLKNCGSLNGKPKVILLHNIPVTAESCHADVNDQEEPQSEFVSEVGGVLADMDLDDETTNTDDIYVVSCTPTVESQSLVQGAHGSYFSHALAHCLQSHAHEEEFLQLMEKLNETLQDEQRSLCCDNAGKDNLDAKPVPSKRHRGRLAKVRIISRPEKKKFFIFPGFDGGKGSQAT